MVLVAALAILLAVVAGVGAPLLGAIVFGAASLLLRALGRSDLVRSIVLPVFLALKLLAYALSVHE